MAGNEAALEASLRRKLDALEKLSLSELKRDWKLLYRKEPPTAFGPDLLRRSIAHRLQEQAYGGLNEATRRELNRIIKTLPKNPKDHSELPRRIKPGSVLVREWKGKSHRVTVNGNSFNYEGKDYSNLSELARKITGTRWNGPRFFGLRAAKDKASQSNPIASPRAGVQ